MEIADIKQSDSVQAEVNSIEEGRESKEDCPECGKFPPCRPFIAECYKVNLVEFPPCVDYMERNLGDVYLESQGRVLDLSFTLKQVCKGKKVAIAIYLSELGKFGREYPRGLKTILYPGHCGPTCQDVPIKGVHFVLPEALDEIGCTTSMCDKRYFRVRIIAHYVSTDFKPIDCDT